MSFCWQQYFSLLPDDERFNHFDVYLHDAVRYAHRDHCAYVFRIWAVQCNGSYRGIYDLLTLSLLAEWRRRIRHCFIVDSTPS